MLHSILIIAASGIVLFHKEFVNAERKAKQIGGIITALLKFSTQRTGLPVAYIELDNVGVSIATSGESRVTCTCAVFHDPADGSEFGQLLARELLQAFTQAYPVDTPALPAGGGRSTGGSGSTGVYSMDAYGEFQGKIAHVIRNAVKPLLDQLQEQRGIVLVLLLNSSHSEHDSDSSLMSMSSGGVHMAGGGGAGLGGLGLQHATADVDKLAVLANHQALMGVATDIMGVEGDTPHSVTLRSRRTTLLLLRVERSGSSLVAVFKNSVDASWCMKQIEKTAEIVRKVLAMASNLKT